MSTALNIKRSNSLFARTCVCERAAARACRCVQDNPVNLASCLHGTARLPTKKSFFIKSPVFTDPSVLVPPCPSGTDPFTAPHNSSMGSVVESHIVLLWLWSEGCHVMRIRLQSSQLILKVLMTRVSILNQWLKGFFFSGVLFHLFSCVITQGLNYLKTSVCIIIKSDFGSCRCMKS